MGLQQSSGLGDTTVNEAICGGIEIVVEQFSQNIGKIRHQL